MHSQLAELCWPKTYLRRAMCCTAPRVTHMIAEPAVNAP